MPEEYLQAAFEIKASCDEISRRILRWHWESKPGPHSFDALLDRIRQRQEESPAYYGHMPDVARKTSWQQLDTTLCMRVLLDPESDAAQPLDLLGNTAHPGAARRACNGAPPATRRPTPPTGRRAGRRPSSLTRRSSALRTPTPAPPSAKRSWPNTTSLRGSICAAAGWAADPNRPPRRKSRLPPPPK